MLVAVVALVVVAGAVAGTLRALAGHPDRPAVPAADDGRPGDVLLIPGYGGSTTALDALAQPAARLIAGRFRPWAV